MVTGQTASINQLIEFLTARILTQHDPQSHQHQNFSTQVSQHNNLPIVEHTQKHQYSDPKQFH